MHHRINIFCNSAHNYHLRYSYCQFLNQSMGLLFSLGFTNSRADESKTRTFRIVKITLPVQNTWWSRYLLQAQSVSAWIRTKKPDSQSFTNDSFFRSGNCVFELPLQSVPLILLRVWTYWQAFKVELSTVPAHCPNAQSVLVSFCNQFQKLNLGPAKTM